MKASHDQYANIIIEYNSQGEAILSPDKQLKLLPCDNCGRLEWKQLNVVSFLCQPCYALWQKGEELPAVAFKS